MELNLLTFQQINDNKMCTPEKNVKINLIYNNIKILLKIILRGKKRLQVQSNRIYISNYY